MSMPSFIDAFAQSFAPSFQSSQRMAQEQMNADREFGLRREAADRDAQRHTATMKELGLRLGAQQRMDAADSALSEGLTRGIATNTGLGLATEPEYDASKVQYTPANQRQLLGLRQAAAVARGQDIGGLIKEGKDLDWQDALKAGGQAYTKLTPEQKAEWWKTQSYDQAIPAFGTYVKSDKTGYVSFQPEGRPAVRLSPDEELRLYAARQAYDTDPERAMAILMSGSATLRGLAKDISDAQGKGATTSNTAQHYRNQDALSAERNRITANHYKSVEDAQRERANAERNQILGSALNYSLGPNGELVPTMTGLKLNSKTGNYEGVSVPLTGQRGIIPASAFDPSRISKSVESMVGQPTGQIGRDGKPVVYTPETAQAAVVQQIIRAHTSQNPATSLNAAGVKAAQEAAGGGGGGGLNANLPLRSPTIDQYYAMSPEALQVRAAAGDQVAKGLLARSALGSPEPAPMGMDRGY